MNSPNDANVKSNVQRFETDVSDTGSYAYTTDRLSAQYANARISNAIAEAYPFAGKRVLDIGCGDGAYTVEFAAMDVGSVLAIDPAGTAIEAAQSRAARLGVDDRIQFAVGNIYELGALLTDGGFDVVVVRGVLHHLPDAERAVALLGQFRGTVLIIEPNGLNPVLKVIEKVSHYHIEHEERSFTPARIRAWLRSAGFEVVSCRLINLVPFFCPDWAARILWRLTPLAERLPLLRDIACGQSVMVAKR